MRRRTALVTFGLVGLSVAGCSSDDDKPEETEATPMDRLAAAKERLDSAGAVTLELTSADLPKGAGGVTGAKGTGTYADGTAKFKGTVAATISGISGSAELISIGQDTWMKFFTPGFVKTDLSLLNAPNPADLFAPSTGIATMIPVTTEAKAGGQARESSEVLDEITGKLPGTKVVELLHVGSADATFDVTYSLTASNELRKAVLTGPFFAGTTSTYTLLLTDYGKSIDITAP